MMSLHSSKRLALLQLTNCIPSCNVKTIKQLSDGKVFISIIETVFPQKTFNLQKEEKQIFQNHEHSNDGDNKMDQDSNLPENNAGKEKDSVIESSKETESTINCNENIDVITVAESTINCNEKIDVMAVAESSENISLDNKDVISSGEGLSSPVLNVDEKNENLSKIYEFIESFIDEKYNLQSGSLVTYKECMTANEFELAKVILFVVSEVVRHYVQSNNAIIQTLSHLDIKVQQDLEDCFNLFINERAIITGTDINRLLSKPAIYKVSPSKSSFVTPKRSCSSKYKRSTSPSASPLLDSVFIDSPLKTYFESPIFTKKDIITKEKEILKTRQTLYEEEIKSSTLQLTVKELEKKLRNKDKEINNLKTRIKEFQETEESNDCDNCAILSKTMEEKEKQSREDKRELNERIDKLSEDYKETLEVFQVEVAQKLITCNYEAKQAEIRCKELETELDDIKFELLKREQDITLLIEKLDEKTKECDISKEKLSAALIELDKIPEYSIRGESIGGVIEKENEDLRQRIKQLELIALSKEKTMVDAMVHCTEDIFDCIVEENPIVIKNEFSPIPTMDHSFASKLDLHPILPVDNSLVPKNELPPFPNMENSIVPKVEFPPIPNKENSVASVNELPPMTISSVQSESAIISGDVKDSPAQSDLVIISEDFKESPNVCVNKYSSTPIVETDPGDSVNVNSSNFIQNESVGALWRQYNDSMTENEGTSEGHLLEKCVNKVMGSLQKFETEFPKPNHKHIKITSRANGSNGLISSSAIKELMEDLKSLKKSLLCLSHNVNKTCNEFQNNILISNSSGVVNGKDCDSNVAINSMCDNCLRKEEELPSLDAEALLEKTKEFDILNEQYLITEASLRLKEKELNIYKKKYFFERKDHLQNIRQLRELEMNCQKLQLELKDVKKIEYELKKLMKREKLFFKSQVKEISEKYAILYGKYKSAFADMSTIRDKNQKLEDDVVSYKTRNEELTFHVKVLENQVKELCHHPKSEPEQSTNIEIETRTAPYTEGAEEQYAGMIPKTEPFSSNEDEASSQNTDVDGSTTASALYTKSLQNPFQLQTADEESFLNHSSIAGLSRNYESEDSLNRAHELNRRNTLCLPQYEGYIQNRNHHEQDVPNRLMELNRRNTLCMPHLQSCYPAEGAPLNHPTQHASNYVYFEHQEGAKKNGELGYKEPAGKKRKVSEMKSEDPSPDGFRTPSNKMRLKFKTPQSLQKLLRLPGRRNRRAATIKPKPE